MAASTCQPICKLANIMYNNKILSTTNTTATATLYGIAGRSTLDGLPLGVYNNEIAVKIGLIGGVQLGNGIISSTTIRTVEATDSVLITHLANITDWDRTNTCAVSPITGQIGVAGGNGAVGATTLRVTQGALEYELVGASDTDEPLGPTGAAGDFLSHIIIMPATTGAGTVTVKDNSTVIFTFTTGTLADLRPIVIPFNLISTGGSWKVTTGANVSVLAFGDFT